LYSLSIFAFCKRLPRTLVESGQQNMQKSLLSTSVLGRRLQRAKIPDAV